MKTIVLHGHLATEFGKEFRFDVQSVAEALQALEANFTGKFYKAIRDGLYQIRRYTGDTGIEENALKDNLSTKTIHIVPVIKGRKGKGKGIVTAILGVALIAAAVYFAPAAAGGGGFLGADLGASVVGGSGLFSGVTFGNIALYGVGLALSGVSSIVTPTPKVNQSNYQNRERPDERPSFLFNGPVNTTEQGGPIMLTYGRIRAGTVVIHAALDVERLPA